VKKSLIPCSRRISSLLEEESVSEKQNWTSMSLVIASYTNHREEEYPERVGNNGAGWRNRTEADRNLIIRKTLTSGKQVERIEKKSNGVSNSSKMLAYFKLNGYSSFVFECPVNSHCCINHAFARCSCHFLSGDLHLAFFNFPRATHGISTSKHVVQYNHILL
jgi:hypothetical protein